VVYRSPASFPGKLPDLNKVSWYLLSLPPSLPPARVRASNRVAMEPVRLRRSQAFSRLGSLLRIPFLFLFFYQRTGIVLPSGWRLSPELYDMSRCLRGTQVDTAHALAFGLFKTVFYIFQGSRIFFTVHFFVCCGTSFLAGTTLGEIELLPP